MLDAALAIGLRRKVAYQDLMAERNTDQLPISAKIPQIMLVIDEGAEILTSTDRRMKELAKKILEVIRMLRAMGIRTVLTALGATGIRARQPDDPPRSQSPRLPDRRRGRGHGPEQGLPRLPRAARRTRPRYKGAGFMGTPESAGGAVQELADPAQPDPRHRPRHLRHAPAPGRRLRARPRATPTRTGGIRSAPRGCGTPPSTPATDTGQARRPRQQRRAEPVRAPQRQAPPRPMRTRWCATFMRADRRSVRDRSRTRDTHRSPRHRQRAEPVRAARQRRRGRPRMAVRRRSPRSRLRGRRA